MQYDPIKRSLGNVFNKSPFLRKTFYRLLDLLLLRAWHVHKELKTWIKQGPKKAMILDAGAGYGQHSFWLNNRLPDAQILAVDVKEEQVADCNRFFEQIGSGNKVKFVVGDLTKFVQADTYDLAISVDVMEHILEDVEVFKNIQEHVRDGYNIKEIEDKLRSAGFTKVEARYQYGSPGKISWRLSMKYPILMLGASKLFFVILPFYYIIAYPVSYVLNWMDVAGNHPTGTGLIVKAWK